LTSPNFEKRGIGKHQPGAKARQIADPASLFSGFKTFILFYVSSGKSIG
jgi:hypothetical protein